jgi:hypothetical protein
VRRFHFAGVAVVSLVAATAAPAMAETPRLRLTPETKVIVAGVGEPAQSAATLIQEWLRRATGTAGGFEVVTRGEEPAAGPRIVVGDPTVVAGLGRHEILVQRQGELVHVAGGSEGAVLEAAAAFLDLAAGIHFYMPGELFTAVPGPRPIEIGLLSARRAPDIPERWMGMFWNSREERDWARRNGVWQAPAGLASHSMFDRFPPARFAARYPEIYPMRDGQRHVPKNKQDQAWQPCFSEPRLVDAALEEAADTLAEHPEQRFITYAVQDSHAFCQCERCSAAVQQFGDGAHGRLYYAFLNRLAPRLRAELPRRGITEPRTLVALAYSLVREPPPFELDPDILVMLVFKGSDIEIDQMLDEGSLLSRWRARAPRLGHHDWAHGDGFLIPRLYMTLAARLYRAVPFAMVRAESYPSWGLDGPKLWVLSQLWWDTGADPDDLYARFCDDMFGPAAMPMHAYFLTLEELWRDLSHDAERKQFRWKDQLTASREQLATMATARALLDEAMQAVETADQRRRVQLFRNSFRVSHHLMEMASAPQVSAGQVELFLRFVREVIAPDPMTLFSRRLVGPEGYVEKRVREAVGAVTSGKIASGPVSPPR